MPFTITRIAKGVCYFITYLGVSQTLAKSIECPCRLCTRVYSNWMPQYRHGLVSCGYQISVSPLHAHLLVQIFQSQRFGSANIRLKIHWSSYPGLQGEEPCNRCWATCDCLECYDMSHFGPSSHHCKECCTAQRDGRYAKNNDRH